MLYNHPLVWTLFAGVLLIVLPIVILWLARLARAQWTVRRHVRRLNDQERDALATKALRKGQLFLAHSIRNPRQLLPGGLEIELLITLFMFLLFAYACVDVFDPNMNYRAR
jgi:hypothetical protein